ncbi:MAG: hypothetical protein OXC01_13895 [Immundisolibacterales bacterium]|nr:hypothetical protein [Immundisolibacterales bacterium]
MKRNGRTLAIAGLLAVSAGCATDPGRLEPERPLRIESATLSLAPEANARRPVRVSLVRVDDERLARDLLAMPGADWFHAGGRDSFLAAHPAAMHDWWEIVPGTTIGPFDLRSRRGRAGVLLCDVGARSPIRVERDGELRIGIDDTGCRIEGGSPSEAPGILGRLLGR